MSETTAAAMIRRFREARPTSRAEREAAKQKGRLPEMWWRQPSEGLDDEEGGRDDDFEADLRYSRGSGAAPNRSSGGRMGQRTLRGEDTVEDPRPSRGAPMRERSPTKPTSLSSSYRARNGYEGPAPSGKVVANSARSIDDFILDDILGLENDNSWDRRRNRLFNSRDGSLNLSLERDRARSSIEKRKEIDRNPLRDSLNIIESIGFRGLDRGDMRLDGLLDKKAPAPADAAPASAPGAGIGSIQQMEEVNKGLEELLKSLGVERQQKEELTKDGLPQSLMQVYNDLNTTFIDFKTKYEGKYSEQEAEEKRRKERDDEMKEVGRREEREKLLKEISVRRDEQEVRLRAMLSAATTRAKAEDEDDIAGDVGVGEASAAMSGQISALQAQLAERMQFLSALHADVMNDGPGSALRPPISASFPVSADSNGTTNALDILSAPAPLRSSRMEDDFFMLGLSTRGLSGPQRNLLEKSIRIKDDATEQNKDSAWFKPESKKPFDAATAIRSDADRHAPTVKHETIARAAIHIQSNLNVAMESLAHRLPSQDPSTNPIPTSAAPPPSYDHVVSSTPALPKYEDLDSHFPTVSVMGAAPPYSAVAPNNAAVNPSGQAGPSANATLKEPATPLQKASLVIDEVLGPMNSSLEKAELEWWKSKHMPAPAPKGSDMSVKSTGILDAKIVSRNIAPPKPTFDEVVSSIPPPLVSVPEAPERMPLRSAAVEEPRRKEDGAFDVPSYISELPSKYVAPPEGRALFALRAASKATPVEASDLVYRLPHASELSQFRSLNVGASSPTSVTVPSSSPSKLEREAYLKQMKAYRENLAKVVK